MDDYGRPSRADNVTSYEMHAKVRAQDIPRPEDLPIEDDGPPVRPRSAVPQIVGLAGLGALALTFLAMLYWRPADPHATLAILLLALAAPMITLDVLLNRDALLGRRLAASDPGRVAIKLCGFAATIAIIACAYWLFPIYRGQQTTVLYALLTLLSPLLTLIPAYVWLTDRLMDEPKDGLYMAGLAALGQWREIERPMLRQFAMGWLVKAFFLPLMLSNTWQDLDVLLTSPAELIGKPAYGWYEYVYSAILFVDVLFASAGYLCTFKLFGLHNRWAEETAFGWMVCLICYWPFADVLFNNYIRYSEGGQGWGYWFGSATTLGSIWGALVLAALAAHIWSTVIFGIRFSNLTNRGIITNGPYRWSKHPAYICKMILYFLIWLPLLSPNSFDDALRKMLGFALLCGIYALRAKAEEAYLMKDPGYRAYAKFIAHDGLVARARRRLAASWANRRVLLAGS